MAKTRFKIHTGVELDNEIKKYCKIALQETFEELLGELKNIIKEDIYNRYTPKWYERTKFLLENDLWKYTMYTTPFGLEGFIRLGTKSAGVFKEDFVHGNPYFGALSQQSFLEIMNNGNNSLKPNPFGFPVKVNREHFWDDFLDYCDKNFYKIYNKKLENYVHISTIYGKKHYSYVNKI